jgi:hypothetical protein
VLPDISGKNSPASSIVPNDYTLHKCIEKKGDNKQTTDSSSQQAAQVHEVA